MKRMVDKSQELEKFGEVIETQNGETTIGHSIEIDGSLRVNGYVGESLIFTKAQEVTSVENSSAILGNIAFIEIHLTVPSQSTSRWIELGSFNYSFNKAHTIIASTTSGIYPATLRQNGSVSAYVSTGMTSFTIHGIIVE